MAWMAVLMRLWCAKIAGLNLAFLSVFNSATATPQSRIFVNLDRERQNRRMVMTPEVLSSYPEIQELHVAEVANYLKENHWMSIS
jgi:hypothetical protein